MIKKWIQKLTKKTFSTDQHTLLKEIVKELPHFPEFLQKRFAIDPKNIPWELNLKEFSELFQLPPPQIIYMEAQLEKLMSKIEKVKPSDAKKLLEMNRDVRVIDSREEWEIRSGKLPNAEWLTPQLLNEILQSENKKKPILVYCHFGVKSLDMACRLAQSGFEKVYLLQGGIDAWSNDVDPTLPRYTGAYC
jgi:rhodanese-related sulfurtransferase